MSKISLTDLVNLQNETTAVNAINANSAAIETAFENTLSRDGTSPNQMSSSLDMNSHGIINLPLPTSNYEPLRVIDRSTLNGNVPITVSPLPTGGTVNQVLRKNSSTNFDTSWASLTSATNPIVILATGQSQLVLTPVFAWTPNPNATVWNWSGVDGNIGTAFTALSSTTVNSAQKFASDIADANPNRLVRLINISFSGRAISNWLPATPAPDVYQNILNNIAPALVAAGVTKINTFVWWQGEGDTVPLNTSYAANHATMMTRFWTNSWFPQETPMLVLGIATTAIGGNPDADNMNNTLANVVNADPDKRRFVYPASLSSATYWDVTNPGHMTGQGYFSAGAMAASAYERGPGRNQVQQIVSDPSTGKVAIGCLTGSAKLTVSSNSYPLSTTTGANLQVVGANSTSCFTENLSFGNFTNYVGKRANGTLTAPSALLINDLITGLGAQGYNGTGFSGGNTSALNIFASENWSGTANGTYASIFNTKPTTLTAIENLQVSPTTLTFNTNATSVSTLPSGIASSNMFRIVGQDTNSATILMDSFGNFNQFVGRRANGTLNTPTALLSGDIITGLGAIGHNGTAYAAGDVAAINVIASENWSLTQRGTYVSIFNTLPTTNTGAESLRINPGTVSIFGTTSGSTALTVAAAASGTLTLPATTDTVLARNTTDTLTNKSFTGNVGFGILSANAKAAVHINANATAPSILPDAGTKLYLTGIDGTTNNTLTMDQFGGGNTAPNRIHLRQSAGTAASPTASLSASILGQLLFSGAKSTSAFYNGAAMFAVAAENFSGTAGGTRVDWYTTPLTTQTSALAATFQPSGGFSVGNTAGAALADPGTGTIGINNATYLMRNSTTWTNNSGASTGTLTNAPAAGNPTKWIRVDDNGTFRFIPAW